MGASTSVPLDSIQHYEHPLQVPKLHTPRTIDDYVSASTKNREEELERKFKTDLRGKIVFWMGAFYSAGQGYIDLKMFPTNSQDGPDLRLLLQPGVAIPQELRRGMLTVFCAKFDKSPVETKHLITLMHVPSREVDGGWYIPYASAPSIQNIMTGQNVEKMTWPEFLTKYSREAYEEGDTIWKKYFDGGEMGIAGKIKTKFEKDLKCLVECQTSDPSKPFVSVMLHLPSNESAKEMGKMKTKHAKAKGILKEVKGGMGSTQMKGDGPDFVLDCSEAEFTKNMHPLDAFPEESQSLLQPQITQCLALREKLSRMGKGQHSMVIRFVKSTSGGTIKKRPTDVTFVREAVGDSGSFSPQLSPTGAMTPKTDFSDIFDELPAVKPKSAEPSNSSPVGGANVNAALKVKQEITKQPMPAPFSNPVFEQQTKPQPISPPAASTPAVTGVTPKMVQPPPYQTPAQQQQQMFGLRGKSEPEIRTGVTEVKAQGTFTPLQPPIPAPAPVGQLPRPIPTVTATQQPMPPVAPSTLPFVQKPQPQPPLPTPSGNQGIQSPANPTNNQDSQSRAFAQPPNATKQPVTQVQQQQQQVIQAQKPAQPSVFNKPPTANPQPQQQSFQSTYQQQQQQRTANTPAFQQQQQQQRSTIPQPTNRIKNNFDPWNDDELDDSDFWSSNSVLGAGEKPKNPAANPEFPVTRRSTIASAYSVDLDVRDGFKNYKSYSKYDTLGGYGAVGDNSDEDTESRKGNRSSEDDIGWIPNLRNVSQALPPSMEALETGVDISLLDEPIVIPDTLPLGAPIPDRKGGDTPSPPPDFSYLSESKRQMPPPSGRMEMGIPGQYGGGSYGGGSGYGGYGGGSGGYGDKYGGGGGSGSYGGSYGGGSYGGGGMGGPGGGMGSMGSMGSMGGRGGGYGDTYGSSRSPGGGVGGGYGGYGSGGMGNSGGGGYGNYGGW